MKQKSSFRLGIGTITVFMVFVVLCFTILSCIAYMKASDDNERSKQQLRYTQAYYKADGQAREIQATLEENLSSWQSQAMLSYFEKHDIQQLNNEISYSVPIKKQQVLSVKLRRDADTIKVISWKTIASEEESK